MPQSTMFIVFIRLIFINMSSNNNISMCACVSPEDNPFKDGHRQLLTDYYRVHPESYNPIDEDIPDNSLTKKFNTTSAMYELNNRMDEVGKLLVDQVAILKDPATSNTKFKAAVRIIEKYVLPMIPISQFVLRDGADKLAPKGGGKAAQKRLDVEKRRTLEETAEYESCKEGVAVLLRSYLAAKGVLKVKGKRKVNSASDRVTRKREREQAVEEDDDENENENKKTTIELPLPRNGKEYGMGEFIDFVTTTTEANTRKRGQLIKAIQAKGYVKRGHNCIYKHLKAHHEGFAAYALDEPWTVRGRPKIWDTADIEAYGMKVKSRQNVKHTLQDLNNALVETMIQKGYALQPGAQLCKGTLIMYDNLVSRQCGINLCFKSNAKTNNRWTAERSNIGTMAFIVVVAATHFYTAEEETQEMRDEYNSLDDETRRMFDMVQNFYDKPIRVQDPALILNQDDTTDYFCEGLQRFVSAEKIGIVAKSAMHNKHINSLHHLEDSGKMNGMRCKRTLLINARGDAAPPVYTFPGLTEKEMPTEEFIALKIDREGDEEKDDDEGAPPKERWITPTTIMVQLRPEHEGIIKPSIILSDNFKFELIRSTFDPNSNTVMRDVTFPLPDDLLQKADCLYGILVSRLRCHIRTRVISTQRKNKCLHWARKNLSLVAAFMIIADHIITDISCLDDSCCLLKPPMSNSFLSCANDELAHLGCYLHYDTNKYVWIRSGSAAGVGGFGQRLDQHTKRAESNSNPDNSQFYDNYPSKKSVRATSRGKRGIYEHLDPYIGVSFRSDIPSGVLDGLLIQEEDEVEWIKNLKLHGKQLNGKYQQMIAYLFELGYDLAISKVHNVSNSPGFEGCGLIFDKNGDK